MITIIIYIACNRGDRGAGLRQTGPLKLNFDFSTL